MEQIKYRIYPTSIESHFLKLNTADGRVWIEQVLPAKKKQPICQVMINKALLAIGADQIAGRFELTPTANPYVYIIQDTIDGRTWYGQWSVKDEECGIKQIEDLK